MGYQHSDGALAVFTATVLLLLCGLLFLQRRHRVNRTTSPVAPFASAVTGIGEQVETMFIRNQPGICSSCGSTESGELYLEYRRITFMYLLGFVTERRYFRICEECGHEDEANRQDTEAQIGGTPRIPSTNRLFFKIVAFTLLGFFLFAIIGECAR